MGRSSRNEASSARRGPRGVPARRERRPRGRSPVVNGPAAASVAWTQHSGTHHRAPSDIIMGSPFVPSCGVGTQPGWTLAVGSQDAHQPTCMDLRQPSGNDFDVLTLADLDAPQPLECVDIGAANLQTIFPFGFESQASESIRTLPFQSDRSLASVALTSYGSCNPNSNVLNAAPIGTPPTVSGHDFQASLCLMVPEELINCPLPEILPLEEAENVDLLDQLFPPEQNQSLENHYASALSPPIQRYLETNHLEGPMRMVNYDPSHAPPNLLQFTPLDVMVHGHHSTTHPRSFPFGHGHQQSPQQPLTDFDGDMQKQPLLGSAPFHSRPTSNEPCVMEYAMKCAMEYGMERGMENGLKYGMKRGMEYGMEFAMECAAGYPPSPFTNNVIPAGVPNIVQAAPKVNMIAPLDSLQAQAPATVSALPNSALIPNGAAADFASANQTNVAARSVTAGRPGNRPPQSRQAAVGKPRHRPIRAEPTPDASPATSMVEVVLSRIQMRRQKHMLLHSGGY